MQADWLANSARIRSWTGFVLAPINSRRAQVVVIVIVIVIVEETAALFNIMHVLESHAIVRYMRVETLVECV